MVLITNWSHRFTDSHEVVDVRSQLSTQGAACWMLKKNTKLTSYEEFGRNGNRVSTGLRPAPVLPGMLQQNAPYHQIHCWRLLQMGAKRTKRKRGKSLVFSRPKCSWLDSFTSCSGSCGSRDSCLIQVLACCYNSSAACISSPCWNEKTPKASLGIIQGPQAAV